MQEIHRTKNCAKHYHLTSPYPFALNLTHPHIKICLDRWPTPSGRNSSTKHLMAMHHRCPKTSSLQHSNLDSTVLT